MEDRELDQRDLGYSDVRPVLQLGTAYRYRDLAYDAGYQAYHPAVRVRIV